MFSIIAAIGKNNELGRNNDLIFHFKEDMQFFREKTTGHKVVMGRKTWESLPGKLQNRENIVISSREFDGPDKIIHDLSQFITDHKDSAEEIFIIGGGQIYAEFLPYAKKLYLTEVDASAPDANVFFPNFDKINYKQTVLKQSSEGGVGFKISSFETLRDQRGASEATEPRNDGREGAGRKRI